MNCGFIGTSASMAATSLQMRHFTDGRVGQQDIYHDNGRLRASGYLDTDGKVDGVLTGYDEDGYLKYEATFVAGELRGNLEYEVTYEDGQRIGIGNEYCENGNIRCETQYHNGNKQGLAKWYQENGEMIVEITYQDDKAVSGRCCKGNKQLTSAHLHRMDKEGIIESGICS